MTTEQLRILTDNPWIAVKDGDARAFDIFKRHYSFSPYRDGRRRNAAYRNRHLICGPGKKLILLTYDLSALLVFRIFKDKSGQKGINCAVFRNEGSGLSSELIRRGEELALRKWPSQSRFYTYVNPQKIESVNPGYCFKMAGWLAVGETKSRRLVILEKSYDD